MSGPEKPAAEELICIRCARHQLTCCQTCEIYTSPGDVRRIADFTGRDDFFEYRVPDNPAYLDNDDDPAWQNCVFCPDGSRRVLRRVAGHGCTFLGSHGCMLPMEVRPLVCRLYPYEYHEQGILPTLAPGCPTQLLQPGQGILQALDMNLADARRWQAQLYQEIRLENHESPADHATDAHRHHVRSAV